MGTRKKNIQPLSKTCSRCGQGFDAQGRQNLCPDCKYPEEPVRQACISTLSFRERQIVSLIGQAKSNKQIAYELRLTVGTIKEYNYHIFRKLKVTNRTQLALQSREQPDKLVR